MKVFTDFHHASLLNSLIMLFEGRLGGQVYRPIGMEWAERKYWNIYDHPATQLQYLTLDQGYRPIDGTPPLNIIEETHTTEFNEKEVYYCRDIDSNQLNKAITFETFCDLDIDIIIASVPQHIEPFKRLIREHMPNAKLIFQIGNAWEPVDVDNVMASALCDLSSVKNSVIYHQEFDLNVFKPSETPTNKTINSFINVAQDMPDWPLFERLENVMPEYAWRAYGGQCRDGAMHGSQELAAAMQASRFVWHVKAGGDGYGHVLFNAAACARPLIVKKSYYVGKLAEKLLINGETCIDIDNKRDLEIIEAIYHWNENNAQMSQQMYKRFKECVDFDKDFEDITAFLGRLV